jgi:hypothetical protein
MYPAVTARLDSALAAGAGNVDRAFEEDDRVVAGEGDARAPECLRGVRDRLRRRRVCERVGLARLSKCPSSGRSGRRDRSRRCRTRAPSSGGKKWLSGFFSIGSTQKPLERPYVVSTTASPHARARSTGRAGLRAGDDPPGRAGGLPLPLTDPELVEHEHPEGVKLVVADASRENGQLLRRVERNPRRLVDELGVDL